MIKHIRNIDINYEEYGDVAKDAIVLLHGWGQNIAMMKPIGDKFKKTNRIIIVDLPGHGGSEEPNEAWDISQFSDMLNDLLKELKIDKPILIGHSFGGQIALFYASKYPVKKLILLASPFRPKIKKQSIKMKTLKALKKVPFLQGLEEVAKKHIGSSDYKHSSGIMREILVKKVNLDMTDDVKKINCPTIIIWGTNDTEVPVEDAKELNKLIKDSGIVIYEGCTHYAYLEVLPQIISVIRVFIGG